jgi:hypothetical protein
MMKQWRIGFLAGTARFRALVCAARRSAIDGAASPISSPYLAVFRFFNA